MTDIAISVLSLVTLIDVAIILCLILIAVIDIRHMIIPNSLVLFIACSAIVGLMQSDLNLIADHILGAIMAFVLFEGTRQVMSRILRREAMGFGDVKLMASGGLWIGAQILPMAILFACLSAAISFGLKMMISKTMLRGEAIPFGPFLAFGMILARFIGKSALLWA